ncbi:hypothetical protein [Cryobacterium psychrophilum]|uniref:Uncharacterized protein n=1 Tax=Cryobacterium psychrophilum TaxID=41988 RepID=A0A4Y8KRP6_9MICO|nr:hypothetical protein [Cryobacterium psychrophilum]TDW28973.1 hypothetical protein EDD25_0645 [Cryobacterium psychrophilum]TFD81250.1 hypothetical protein E3T53_03360 [Cryobacterium psychrophilum]
MTYQPSNPNVDGETDLGSRLSVINEQPLEARAAAFVQLHEELLARLEGADTPIGVDAIATTKDNHE